MEELWAPNAARGGAERKGGSGVILGGVFWMDPLEPHDDGSLPGGGRACVKPPEVRRDGSDRIWTGGRPLRLFRRAIWSADGMTRPGEMGVVLGFWIEVVGAVSARRHIGRGSSVMVWMDDRFVGSVSARLDNGVGCDSISWRRSMIMGVVGGTSAK